MSEYSKETVLKTVAELFDMVKEQQVQIEYEQLQTECWRSEYLKMAALRDELQKRVDAALSLFEYPTESWEEVVNQAVKALRGEHEH